MTHTPTPWEFDGNCGGYITQGGDKIARAYACGDAEFITKAVNNYDALVEALTGLSNMYSHAWDRVDGGLIMFGSSVERFDKAHYAAQVLLCTINGTPLPFADDEEESLQQTPGA